MMTPNQLAQAVGCSLGRAVKWVDVITAAMNEFDINTRARQASFLSQVGHESGHLFYVEEVASGMAYEGRADLGNIQPGDGVRYKGRGLIQITGRDNYRACGTALHLDLINHPELLCLPANAARSAGWFWKSHGLNELSDTGDQRAVTKRVNGGYNGLADRLALFNEARKALA